MVCYESRLVEEIIREGGKEMTKVYVKYYVENKEEPKKRRMIEEHYTLYFDSDAWLETLQGELSKILVRCNSIAEVRFYV